MKRFLAIGALIVPFALQAMVSVKVLPNPAEAKPGGAIQFKAEVMDSLGKPVPAKINWFVAPEELGKIGPDGLFLAGKQESKGIVRAVAKISDNKEVVGHALVTVKAEVNREMLVNVMPKHSFVKKGGSQQFEVKVVGREGEPISDAHIVFKVVPQDMGSITEKGLFTAGDQYGKCRVVVLAKSGELEGVGEAVAIIGDPEMYLPVKIHPDHTVLKTGGTQKFEFEILGPKPESAPEVKWTVIPENFGTITPEGLFVAGDKKGKGIVQLFVKADKKVGTDRAVVIVGEPEERIRVKIYPKRAIIEPNKSFKFHAEVFDAEGNPADIPIKWAVKPKEAGTITEDGLFTADDKAGKCEIVAFVPPSLGVGKDVATVIIQKELIVKINPGRALIEPNKTQKFEAKVFDQAGNPVEAPIRWVIEPKEAGTITEDGVFTAGERPGKCAIIAFVPPKFGLGKGIAEVIIQRKLEVEITPKSAKVTVGGSQKFEAKALYNGTPVEAKFIWKVEPSNMGTITETGIFTAGNTPGLCKVIAIVAPKDGIGRNVAGIKITQ